MTSSPALPPLGLPPFHRADIDGLRAIAVLAVVGFHLAPTWLRGGYLGVDVFFVISGYLITGIIWRERGRGRFDFWGFVRQRARRLLPTLSLVLLSTALVGWTLMLPHEFQRLGGHLLASGGFVLNGLAWRESGYFDTVATTKPLLHLWSLAIEVQFYVIWPWVVGGLMRLRPGSRTALLLGLAAVSWLTALAWGSGGAATTAFYSPLTRVWEFVAGSAVALWHAGALAGGAWIQPQHRLNLPQVQGPTAVGLGLAMIAVSLVMMPLGAQAQAWWTLLPVLGTAMCLAAKPAAGRIQRGLTLPAMRWLGEMSYGWYLWHWPLLVWARLMVADYPHVSWRVLTTALALLLAYGCTRYWEPRFRGVRAHASLRGIAVLWGGVWVLGGLALIQAWEPRLNDPVLQRMASAVGDWDHPGALKQGQREGVPLTLLPGNDERVVMWGDSHVEQYGPRLSALAEEQGTAMPSVELFTDWACPPILGVRDPQLPSCLRLHDVAWRRALQADVGVVVVGGCWSCYFLGEMKPLPDPTDPYRFEVEFDGQTADFRDPLGDARALTLRALGHTLSELKAAGKRVFLLLDNPSGEAFSPLHFVQGARWTTMSAQQMPTHATVDEAQWVLHQDLRAVARHAGVDVLDPWPSLCPQRPLCWRTSPQGEPLYKDDNHLRPWAVRVWADYLDAAFLPPKLDVKP